ncbi:MAG: adenosylcobinamide kinase/adenosylcobinamide-phosphate guanylyltransferase [Nonlabens sp.]|jgi:adenosylcobinamide kinase/adenosylcobinamide-phosphate guanylyltransferase
MSTHLMIGGARSGKSRHAMELALASGLQPVYVATSMPYGDDGEFADRVARHRGDRGPEWRTVEEPIDLIGVLTQHRAPDTFVVVDCLTLWLTNLLFADDMAAAVAIDEDPDAVIGVDVKVAVGRVSSATHALCEAVRLGTGPVAFVSNEVGQGTVPMHALTRSFRDQQGWLNQKMAHTVDHVRLLVAGIPLIVKG